MLRLHEAFYIQLQSREIGSTTAMVDKDTAAMIPTGTPTKRAEVAI